MFIYFFRVGRPVTSISKSVVVTCTSEFEELALDYCEDRSKAVRTIPCNVRKLNIRKKSILF